MYFRKINNATLWEKIKKLRKFIQEIEDFKKRTCYSCRKALNIYDFLSDNLEFSPEYILKLWQAPSLEFHCCECFKFLKTDELKQIEQTLSFRNCKSCKLPIDLYKYSKNNSYLKIHELKSIWLNLSNPIFCDNFCMKKYHYDLINQ